MNTDTAVAVIGGIALAAVFVAFIVSERRARRERRRDAERAARARLAHLQAEARHRVIDAAEFRRLLQEHPELRRTDGP